MVLFATTDSSYRFWVSTCLFILKPVYYNDFFCLLSHTLSRNYKFQDYCILNFRTFPGFSGPRLCSRTFQAWKSQHFNSRTFQGLYETCYRVPYSRGAMAGCSSPSDCEPTWSMTCGHCHFRPSFPADAGTHRRWRPGQARIAWVAGYERRTWPTEALPGLDIFADRDLLTTAMSNLNQTKHQWKGVA